MKMKGAKQVHYDAGPNMTPLVDVVMVILIFLMLAGKFGNTDHYLASTVPIRAKGSGKPTDPVPNDVETHVFVDSFGDDRFSARVDGIEEPVTEIAPLQILLEQRLAALLATGKQPDNIQMLIEPGLNVKYTFLAQVYAAILDAHTGGDGPNAKHYTKVAFDAAH